jgi:hypothetical protein
VIFGTSRLGSTADVVTKMAGNPAPAALAAAIATVADLEAFLDRARSGLAAVQVNVDAAGRDLLAAEAALQEAQQSSNDAKGALRRAMGAPAQPSMTALQHLVDEKRAAFNEIQRERDLQAGLGSKAVHRFDRSRPGFGVIIAEENTARPQQRPICLQIGIDSAS